MSVEQLIVSNNNVFSKTDAPSMTIFQALVLWWLTQMTPTVARPLNATMLQRVFRAV